MCDAANRSQFHLDCQEDQLKAGIKPGDIGYAVETEDRHGILSVVDGDKTLSHPFPTIKSPNWSEYYSQVAKALAGAGEVPVKAEEAADVILLVELARQSSKEGRTLDV